MDFYAGLLGGYGLVTQDPGGPDPYRLTYGGDIGFTLPVVPIYLGVRSLWTTGSTRTLAYGQELSRKSITFGTDLGYEASLGGLVLRPTVGVGAAYISASSSLGDHPLYGTLPQPWPTPNRLYISPGIAALTKFKFLYVGGEIRYNLVTRHDQPDSVSILVGAGFTL